MTYLGLDPTASEEKPSAYAVLDDAGSLTSCGTLETDQDIVEWALNSGAHSLGIDCPLGLPAGLCCLEEDCPCTPTSSLKGRECERKLARRSISCYFTTKRSFIKPMIHRGMALTDRLVSQGLEVIEVYPYATKVSIWGKPIPKKTTSKGRAFLQERLGCLIPGVAFHHGKMTHDMYDAILAAYTAYLHSQGKTELLGIEDEGFIVVPKTGAGWLPSLDSNQGYLIQSQA